MSLKWNIGGGDVVQLQSLRLAPPHRNIVFLRGTSFRTRRKRRRLKRSSYVLVCNNQLSPFSSSSFSNLLPQLNSLDLLAPALGFTTALSILYYTLSPTTTSADTGSGAGTPGFIGDWALFTSPTPFNRFVTLRCASLLLEDSDEKLVKEDGHPVRFNRGRVQQIVVSDDQVLNEKLAYQRICVNTDDGGVVSLDWPADLDLTKEHGLDTTVLIIPGTADGSMDENVRLFVCECLRRGCFPIVMNPRGCARSPITTPRLFTAADSDDVCTTVQFINKARPWTTLMGVGWGYGANMLTKYLAEVGEKTPLTAATCIDNPFDLNASAGLSPHVHDDQSLTQGLIDILQSNKELFQGRPKGFDVEKALQAMSLQDFEEAISMVSYGFDSIEDFYGSSSTRYVVGNVKIPLLFIQNNDDAVPLFSIPRNSIAENPFTSLLICSCSLHDKSTTGTSAVSWCQHLVIEWLIAVELGLLKGRHPLLEGTDVTINPSKRLNLPQLDASNGHTSHPLKEILKENDANVYSSSVHGSRKTFETEDKELGNNTNGTATQTNLVGTEGEVEPVDSERGQVLQSTEVVMNMLDAAMPETLSEEQKNKVLSAVGQGETLINALQGAVPEDVRGKLTSSVTSILQNRKLNLNGLPNIGQIPNVTSGLNAKTGEKVGVSTPEKEPSTSDQSKGDSNSGEGSHNQPSKSEAPSGVVEPEVNTSSNSGKSADGSQFQSTSNQGGDTSNSINSSHEEVGSNNGSAELSKEKAAHASQFHESDSSAKPEISSGSERSDSSEDQISEHVKVEREGVTASSDMKEDSGNQQKEEKDAQDATDKNNTPNARTEEKSSSASSSENQLMEKEGSENQIKDDSSGQPVSNHSSSSSPSFSVSQAFDALTGMDDSTQVAVSSVFSVIEDMITQLEENRDDKSSIGDKHKVDDKATDSEPRKHQASIDSDLQHKDGKSSMTAEPQVEENRDDESSVGDKHKVDDKATDSEPRKHLASIDSSLQHKEDGESSMTAEPNESSNHPQSLSISKISAERKDEVRVLHNSREYTPHFVAKLPYGNPLYTQHLQNDLISNIKNDKSLDLDAATALFLDYIPEEGQWKLLEQSGDGRDDVDDVISNEGLGQNVESPLPHDARCKDKIIEPAYVVLDSDSDSDPIVEYEKRKESKEKLEIGDDRSGVFLQLVKESILNSLKVEVCRRVQATDMEDIAPMLAKELEHVAGTVSLAAVHGKEHIMSQDDEDLLGPGTLQAEHIIEAISSAVQGTRYMKRVIPVGIIVGSSLASLRKFFDIAAADSRGKSGIMADQINNSQKGYHLQADRMVADTAPLDKVDQNNDFYSSDDVYEEKDVSSNLGRDTVMVGAVTAALGASALLVHQQDSYNDGLESSRTSSMSFDDKDNQHEPGKLEEMPRSGDTSLAEKAMSAAGSVVPTKKDGAVDQERLVAMLADLGQRGGILRLVGKAALLWGGMRGAMSLTDKLISFLRIAERPLFQRMLAFVFMVLVLWTPVVVPLLPILVQNWAGHSSSKITELTCIIGLYASIMILVVLWGKRIRGYKDSLERYGLETTAKQIRNFLCGLIGGVMVVLLVHSINVLLGFVSLSLPAASSSTDAGTLLKLFGKTLRFVGQGLATSIGVALVEELLFRSWLPDEIAVDLGYNQGIILSGLAFSLSQRSLRAIPGLWLLSVALAGARHRSQGSLFLPIGLRAGIMASSFVLKAGGFLTNQPTFPSWVSGGDPFQPFTGVVGLAMALFWAVILYPKKPQNAKILTGTTKELKDTRN